MKPVATISHDAGGFIAHPSHDPPGPVADFQAAVGMSSAEALASGQSPAPHGGVKVEVLQLPLPLAVQADPQEAPNRRVRRQHERLQLVRRQHLR